MLLWEPSLLEISCRSRWVCYASLLRSHATCVAQASTRKLCLELRSKPPSARPHRVPGRELAEFLSTYYLCAKANLRSFFRQIHRVCLQNSVSLSSKTVLSKQYSAPFPFLLSHQIFCGFCWQSCSLHFFGGKSRPEIPPQKNTANPPKCLQHNFPTHFYRAAGPRRLHSSNCSIGS